MSHQSLTALTLVTLTLLFARAMSAQHPQMPAGMSHEAHLAQMKKDADLKTRGTAAMGFDQDAAEHHFVLLDDGGAIEVGAAAAGDSATRGSVRRHLQDIARDFAGGVFDKPFATHAETPEGVPAMERLKHAIRYAYEDTPRGGRVRISSRDGEAIAAIHAFLRYQIVEHKTGDALTPRKR